MPPRATPLHSGFDVPHQRSMSPLQSDRQDVQSRRRLSPPRGGAWAGRARGAARPSPRRKARAGARRVPQCRGAAQRTARAVSRRPGYTACQCTEHAPAGLPPDPGPGLCPHCQARERPARSLSSVSGRPAGCPVGPGVTQGGPGKPRATGSPRRRSRNAVYNLRAPLCFVRPTILCSSDKIAGP